MREGISNVRLQVLLGRLKRSPLYIREGSTSLEAKLVFVLFRQLGFVPTCSVKGCKSCKWTSPGHKDYLGLGQVATAV